MNSDGRKEPGLQNKHSETYGIILGAGSYMQSMLCV